MKYVLLLLLLAQLSCAGTASYIRREAAGCRPASTFTAYTQCVDTLLAASGQPEAVSLRQQLPTLEVLVQDGKETANDAADWVDAQLRAWHLRESDSMQSGLATAAKVVVGAAVIVGTVALVYAVSRSEANARGCCSWHGGVSHCGYAGYYVCSDLWVSSCRCR